MLIELFIAQACIGSSGMNHDACSKALEAAAVQYEVKQNVNDTETKVTKIVEKKVETVTGKEFLAVTLFAAKAYKEKQVSTRVVREDGIIPSINTSLGLGNGKITFGWSF